MNKIYSKQYLIIKGILCTVIKENIKNTYIIVKNENVIIKTSKNIDDNYIKNHILKNINWIKKSLSKQKLKFFNQYNSNGKIKYLGEIYSLKVEYTCENNLVLLQDNYILVKINKRYKKISEEIILEKLIKQFYYIEANKEFFSIMNKLINTTKLIPQDIKIKDLKATWGICSSNKKISLNLNLMAYSRHAIEYVCLHELCHLKYMNHSKDFWNLVEYYMPNYKLAQNELKG